ncbi:nucleotidyltransferase family protein [Pelagicoccus mobilis]|uniref:Nucleotidyltransferase family protein n=1 Tax=Pelagicoccus mobilis TaxID=415221 RepID=A0A934VN03_9BACT|nr:nucleotidyltransferase family protein [Pelagicoccus mobilis]MBK1875722.1 nucleotidyltransferase family protein [Pelagicoccus mobilis]
MTRIKKLATVVLAAGESKRFGSENKLLHRVEGEPLLGHVLNAVTACDFEDVVVVLGHEADSILPLLEGLPVRTVLSPNYREGMGESLRAGVEALQDADLDGLIVCLSDLPKLRPHHVEKVIDAFASNNGSSVVVPVFKGQRGHPVCFPKRLFEKLSALSGDRGARDLIRVEGERGVFLEMDDDACIRDVDEK